MKREFLPFELAVKLKDLGFDEPCLGNYIQYHSYSFECERSGTTVCMYEDKPVKLYIGRYTNDFGRPESKICSAPLWQQSFDWFREKYKLLSFIDIDVSYRIYSDDKRRDVDIDSNRFETYQEARKACLEKLIELVDI